MCFIYCWKSLGNTNSFCYLYLPRSRYKCRDHCQRRVHIFTHILLHFHCFLNETSLSDSKKIWKFIIWGLNNSNCLCSTEEEYILRLFYHFKSELEWWYPFYNHISNETRQLSNYVSLHDKEAWIRRLVYQKTILMWINLW